jgi:hypothetical protein
MRSTHHRSEGFVTKGGANPHGDLNQSGPGAVETFDGTDGIGGVGALDAVPL